ncbi:Histone-lysine N-methyltransferase NSD3, variant 2, partial [Bonamia ostreae]
MSDFDPYSDDREESFEEEDVCFICGDGGNLLLCDFEDCKKVLHPKCANIEEIPDGEWHCPSHFCCKCNSDSVKNLSCSYCSKAYCEKDLPKKLKNLKQVEFQCEECLSKNLDPKQRFVNRLVESMRRRHEMQRNYRVGGVDIDFYDLYSAVVAHGGAKRV